MQPISDIKRYSEEHLHDLVAIPGVMCVWLPQAMANPDIALALLFLGIIGIYSEFSRPGLIFPGVAGSVVALLGLAGLSMFPIDWRGAAAIAVAFICFVLEARYVTHGTLTVGGAIAMLIGWMVLIADPAHRIHFATAAAITVPFAPISSFLFSLAMRARRNKVVTGAGKLQS
jgi:membrane-bound serine protease (ClpP class)